MADTDTENQLTPSVSLECHLLPTETYRPGVLNTPTCSIDTVYDQSNNMENVTKVNHHPTPSILKLNSILPKNSVFKKSVNFSHVKLYHFDRIQGFTCIPSQGGSTLGMLARHWKEENLTVLEHQNIRRHHRNSALLQFCLEGKLLLSLQQFKILERKVKCSIFPHITNHSYSTSISADPDFNISFQKETATSSLSRNASDSTSTVLTDTLEQTEGCYKRKHENDSFVSGNIFENDKEDLEFLDCLEEYYFLQPISNKKRRTMLRKAGLLQIDGTEKKTCQSIRLSRTQCGCNCTDGICEPETCFCALNNIPCQVDRINFPCACLSPSYCKNASGRIEFNPVRVKTHYLHTKMRLELERQQENESQKIPTGLEAEKAAEQVIMLQNGNAEQSENSSNNTWLHNSASYLDSIHAPPVLIPNHSPGIMQNVIDGFQKQAPDLCDQNQSAEFNFKQNSFNTTVNGSCKECQSDKYMHVIFQGLAKNDAQLPICNPTTDESSISENANDNNFVITPHSVENYINSVDPSAYCISDKPEFHTVGVCEETNLKLLYDTTNPEITNSSNKSSHKNIEENNNTTNSNIATQMYENSPVNCPDTPIKTNCQSLFEHSGQNSPLPSFRLEPISSLFQNLNHTDCRFPTQIHVHTPSNSFTPINTTDECPCRLCEPQSISRYTNNSDKKNANTVQSTSENSPPTMCEIISA